MDTDSEPLAVTRASFGNLMYDAAIVNLMYPPPEYADLCSLPEAYNSSQSALKLEHLPLDVNTDIALLVRNGTCSPQTKARVAAEIGRLFLPYASVQYIIVYSDDGEDKGAQVRLQPDVVDEYKDLVELEKLEQTIGIMYMPYHEGAELRLAIKEHAITTETTPILYHDDNLAWSFYAKIERPPGQRDPGNLYRRYGGGFGPYHQPGFYKTRLVVLALLILIPCSIFFKIWWTAGGRIRWHRTDDGRIVGVVFRE
jgi:hypothetical protein